MEALKASNFTELGLKIAENAKRDSREEELALLELDVEEGLKEYVIRAVKGEKKYRRVLDDEIENYRRELS